MPEQQANHSKTPVYHSRYDPMREAERFVEASIKDKQPGVVLILGPGENFIKKVIERRLPWALCYSLHPADCFPNTTDNPELEWFPGHERGLQQFLRRALFNEHTAAGVAVLEWEPVMSAFPGPARMIRNAVTRALASAAADRASVNYWASNWLKNSLRFIARLVTPADLVRLDCDVAVCAAGPSLNDCLPHIRNIAGKTPIWALASAVPALMHAGIRPDLAVATDPGFWNGVHLQTALRYRLPVALPPSAYACTGLLDSGIPIVPLDTGLIFEQAVLTFRGIKGQPAMPFGTSAGTALDLALRAHTGVVRFYGLDLAACDTRTHAVPYAFDILQELRSERKLPLRGQVYAELIHRYPESSGGWRFSRAFSAYANELEINAAQRTRIVRFSPSPVVTDGLPSRWPAETAEGSPAARPREAPVRALAPLQAGSSGPILDKLLERGLTALEQACASHQALDFGSALTVKALCGQAGAPILAKAARGHFQHAELAAAKSLLEQHCCQWKKRFT